MRGPYDEAVPVSRGQPCKMGKSRRIFQLGGFCEAWGATKTRDGGKELMHKGFEDPAAFNGSDEKKMAVLRHFRDEIRDWITEVFGGET